MNTKRVLCLALVLGTFLLGRSTLAQRSFVANAEIDKNLSKRIFDSLTECQKIKPGMMRQELKTFANFTPAEGMATAAHQTFNYLGCPFTKIDIDFKLSGPKQEIAYDDRPTDTVSKVSKPYLEWNTVLIDRKLEKQLKDILAESEKITPGMKRAELLTVFTTEGGLSTAKHRTFAHRRCPYIKVDVDFIPSEPKQKPLDERPTDTINKISKLYLDQIVSD